MSEDQFPRTIAAAKKIDKDSWALGDALLAECGPPSEAGVQDGSQARIRAAAEALLENGMEFDIRTLAVQREVAFWFPPSSRVSTLPWRTHMKAQSPEFLNSVIEGTPKGTKITSIYVDDFRRLQRTQEKSARKAEEAKADAEAKAAWAKEAEAAEAERKANSEAERQAAKEARAEAKREAKEAAERKAAAKTAPSKGTKRGKALDPSTIATMAEVAGFMSDAGKARFYARSARKHVEPRLSKIPADALPAMVETALETLNAWKSIVDLLRTQQSRAGRHLHAVNQ